VTAAAPPIQNLDSFDVVGERIDGGVDLVVTCSGPLDASPGTLDLIERKVLAYLKTIAHENFARVYPAAQRGRVRIFVCCEHSVSDAAGKLIDTLTSSAGLQGVALSIVKNAKDIA
jgi:hypothetical protein